MHECRHILTNGRRCRAIALTGQPFCYFHKRVHRHTIQPPPAPEEKLRIPVLEDQNSVQLAVAQVLDALSSARIDRHQAALYLRGIQIASNAVRHGRLSTSSDSVEHLTQSEAGDDLAPEERICFHPYTCPKCDLAETCEKRKPKPAID